MDTSARFFQEEINVKVSTLKIHTLRPLSNPFVSGQSLRFYPQRKGTCFLVLLLAGTFIFLCLWPLKYLVPLSVGCGCGLNYTTCSSNSPAFWTSSLPQQCEPIPIINLIYYTYLIGFVSLEKPDCYSTTDQIVSQVLQKTLRLSSFFQMADYICFKGKLN